MNCLDCAKDNIECKHLTGLESGIALSLSDYNSLDRNSRRILESLQLNSFEDIMNAFEEFLSDLRFFKGPNDFAKAEQALDMAALAFSKIDKDHDFMFSKDDLQEFLGSDAARNSAKILSWLLVNFDALERMSLLKGTISRRQIEAARDLFHGLHYLQIHFDALSHLHGAGKRGISKSDLEEYCKQEFNRLDQHQYRGLLGLASFLGRIHGMLDVSLLHVIEV